MILMYILKVIGVILGIVIIYVILGLLIPYIPVSAKDDGQKKEIPVYIYTNGVHTDIVMPVKMTFRTGVLKYLLQIQNQRKQIISTSGSDGETKAFIWIHPPGPI